MNDVVSFASYAKYFSILPTLTALFCLYHLVKNLYAVAFLRIFKDRPYNDPDLEEMAQKLRAAGFKTPPYGRYALAWAAGFAVSLYLYFSLSSIS